MPESQTKVDVEKVAKGAGAILVGATVGKLVFFLNQILISRCLGLEVFGLYALGMAAVKACEIFARLGLNVGGMRFVSIYRDDNPEKVKGVIISAAGFSVGIGIVVGVAFFFTSNWISVHFFQKPQLIGPFRLFAFSIPFTASMTVLSSLLQGFHSTKYTVYVRDIIQPVTNFLLTIFMILLNMTLDGLILAYIISHIIGCLVAVAYTIRCFPSLKYGYVKPSYEIKELIQYSIPLLFVGFLQYFLSNTDILMLGALGSTSDAGIYRAASQLPLAMTIFLFASNSIYGPIAADLHNKSETERLSNIFKATTRWISYMVIPLFIIMVFSSKELMMIFGKEYVADGYKVVIILSCGQLINCITGGVGITLVMTGKQLVGFFSEVLLVIVNVLLNLALIPKYGVIGAAISSSVSVAVVNVVRTYVVNCIYKMHPFSEGSIRPFVLMGIISLTLYGLNNYFLREPHYFINAFVVCSLFGMFYHFMKKNEDDLYFMSIIKAKILRIIT